MVAALMVAALPSTRAGGSTVKSCHHHRPPIQTKPGCAAGKLSATPRGYTSPLELRDDVRLTFDNFRLFNPTSAEVAVAWQLQ